MKTRNHLHTQPRQSKRGAVAVACIAAVAAAAVAAAAVAVVGRIVSEEIGQQIHHRCLMTESGPPAHQPGAAHSLVEPPQLPCSVAAFGVDVVDVVDVADVVADAGGADGADDGVQSFGVRQRVAVPLQSVQPVQLGMAHTDACHHHHQHHRCIVPFQNCAQCLLWVCVCVSCVFLLFLFLAERSLPS